MKLGPETLQYLPFHLADGARHVPFLPLVAIDNVFASPRFAAIATKPGPRLGSDHRPIIVDIALAETVRP